MSTIRVGNIGPLTGNTSVIADPGISGGMSLVSMGVVTLSGTSVDFTGIPSWARRISINFNGLSTSGSSIGLIQLGSGSITTSGYSSTGWTVYTNQTSSTSGFLLAGTWAGSQTFYGRATISLVGSNVWVEENNIGSQNQGWNSLGSGTVTLSGALDRVRITTSNGTDTFDAGTVNVFYE
jgi:hypothetical protein